MHVIGWDSKEYHGKERISWGVSPVAVVPFPRHRAVGSDIRRPPKNFRAKRGL